MFWFDYQKKTIIIYPFLKTLDSSRKKHSEFVSFRIEMEWEGRGEVTQTNF